MRIGAMIGADGTKESIDAVVQLGKEIEAAGLDHVWIANIFSYDAITTLALIGRETSRVRLGTAVTPTYPRHPGALAQQALTTAAASNNRFTFGIGLSASGGDRKHVWYELRQAGKTHAGISECPDASVAR